MKKPRKCAKELQTTHLRLKFEQILAPNKTGSGVMFDFTSYIFFMSEMLIINLSFTYIL